MHWNIRIVLIVICTVIVVYGREDSFNMKCKRNCNTVQGTLECWKETTDGFAYGLSTAMIDFCQVILNLRNLTDEKESWFDISHAILTEQIEQYSLQTDTRQLTKENIEQIAVTLLKNCLSTPLSVITSEPTCPSCSESQISIMNRWRISSIIIGSIDAILVFLTLFLYAFYRHYTNRSYMPLP